MKEATKIDLYKLHKDDYAAVRKPRLVDIGKAVYLTIDGEGAPGGPQFTEAIGALYGVAFTVKMTRKFAGDRDYSVCKLEALWSKVGTAWAWKLMIRTPEFVTRKEVEKAVAVLLKRGKTVGVKRVHLEALKEDRCVQVLHVGPYEGETTTIEAMKAFVEAKGLRFDGPHHEIYLSDPRRVPPERLKTILRQPVRPVPA